MSEDQLTLLFGDLTVVQATLWIMAFIALLSAFILAIAWVWPKISAFVASVNLLISLGTRLTGIEGTLEKVRAQVENSHKSNLREELDQDRVAAATRHSEIMDEMSGMKKDIGRQDTRDIERGKDLRSLTEKITAVDNKVIAHLEWSHGYVSGREQAERDLTKRLKSLEDTANPAKNRKEGNNNHG